MLIMKSGKRHMTDTMEEANQEKIRTLREKEAYKYLGILVADIIKRVKKNISGELQRYSKQNYIAGTLSKR